MRHANTAISTALILLAAAAGCSSKSTVPSDATLIVSQSGPMGFLAPSPGTVFIVDSSSGRTVYSAPMTFGDKLAFLPKQKQILFNGNIISQPDLDESHNYRLYFLKG